MKKIIALLALIATFTTFTVFADTYVQGYTRSDGTYVQGYTRSSPNNTVRDNYSYKGNTNPYTGSTGSNYNRSSPSSEYYNGGTYGNSNPNGLYQNQ